MPSQSRFWGGVLIALFVLLLSGCDQQPVRLRGKTMGTTWHVTLTRLPAALSSESAQAGLEQVFKTVNDQMSTWQADSELTRFNQSSTTDWQPVSEDLAAIMELALYLSVQSHGAYDVTVGPLVNLWGFGPSNRLTSTVPAADALQAARARVGYHKLHVRQQPPALRKTQADLYVDLSSIAKGYGVDQARRYLETQGVQHGMVEVGGEVTAWGNSPRGDTWRIAIEQPIESGRVVQQGIRLRHLGLATSGDYRNFFTEQGVRYSHTIDPSTGYPVTDSLASVSVLATNTTLADGYATLLMVLGLQRGLAFAQQQQLAAYFIERTDVGFVTHVTDAFKPYLIETSH